LSPQPGWHVPSNRVEEIATNHRNSEAVASQDAAGELAVPQISQHRSIGVPISLRSAMAWPTSAYLQRQSLCGPRSFRSAGSSA